MKANLPPSQLRQMTPSWDLLRPNWQLISDYYVGIIYLLLLPTLTYVWGSTLLGKLVVTNNTITLRPTQIQGLSVMVVALIWTLVNIGPATLLMLSAADKQTKSLGEYYRQGLQFSWRLTLYYVTFGVMVIAGLLLFIVPGLFILRRYILGPFYLVDKNCGVAEAMKLSAADSKPYSAAIWGMIGVEAAFVLAAGLFNVVPYAGIVLSQIAAYGCIFIPVLRYREIVPRH